MNRDQDAAGGDFALTHATATSTRAAAGLLSVAVRVLRWG